MQRQFLKFTLFFNLYACIQGNLFAYTAYFSSNSNSNVTVINTTDNSTITTISEVPSAYSLAITPNGRYLYVSGGASPHIYKIDTSTNTIIYTINTPNPRQIATSPDGQSLYVTNALSNTVKIYSTSTNTLSSFFDIGEPSETIAINPAGTLAYIGTPNSNTIYIVNLDNNFLTVHVTNPHSVNNMIFSTDGTKVYVASSSSSENDPVYIYDTSNHTIFSDYISVGGDPSSMTLTPDGKFLYVANQNTNNVSVINTQTDTVTNTISLATGQFPDGIAITPDGNTLYTANYTTGNSSILNATNNTLTANISLTTDLTDVIIAPLATLVSLSGSQQINDFGVRYELYNTLNWTSSITPATIGYNIYRNGTLIGSTTGINETTYVDHNREEGVSYQYSVRSRAVNGDLSYPVSVTVE